MLFHILHILSVLSGPNIFLSICLSKMRRLFSSFAVKVQVSDEYVTAGFIIVFFHFVFFFFLGISILLVLHWHSMLVAFCSKFYIHFVICIQNRTQIIKIFYIFNSNNYQFWGVLPLLFLFSLFADIWFCFHWYLVLLNLHLQLYGG
jgi:hypothetical protein